MKTQKKMGALSVGVESESALRLFHLKEWPIDQKNDIAAAGTEGVGVKKSEVALRGETPTLTLTEKKKTRLRTEYSQELCTFDGSAN